MSSSSPSLTASAPAQTTTHTIPNLKGGANPATPRLAGLITGSCVLLAWVVCFIYWWWNRRREKQDLAEMEANRKMKQVNGGGISTTYAVTGPMRRTRSRATSSPMRPYPPGTRLAEEKSDGERPASIVSGERNRTSIRSSDGPRPQSPTAIDSRSKSPPSKGRGPLDYHGHGRVEVPIEPPHHGTGPLTPMKEVPTRDEASEPPPKP